MICRVQNLGPQSPHSEILGPGEISVDHALGLADSWNGFAGLAIAAGVGAAGAIGQLLLFFRPPGEVSKP